MVEIDTEHLKVMKKVCPPMETTITLNFEEIELITRERNYRGFLICTLIIFQLYLMIQN